MNLYIARHGQTTWNAQNKVCGITDAELTDKQNCIRLMQHSYASGI